MPSGPQVPGTPGVSVNPGVNPGTPGIVAHTFGGAAVMNGQPGYGCALA